MHSDKSPLYILAIDCGTQSVRALLFDLEGNLVSKAQIHIEPYFSSHPGWANQDPSTYWDALCLACCALFAGTTVDKNTIKAIPHHPAGNTYQPGQRRQTPEAGHGLVGPTDSEAIA